ncbi:hypothetical protein AAE02nite_14020 [Adhaeribacter aerolatus]|uniref:Heparinase n=1 Tax=Adhaeribacter aerolatus TaxID=670289 RepID=A0A512AVJ7_9BACT|nr:hypothetical protein AAE02nite_14020 [Adhaeribacter aerolatus]
MDQNKVILANKPALSSESTKTKYQLSGHPRLFFTREEEQEILQKAKNNILLGQLIETLKNEAEISLNTTPQVYKPNVQLLQISREQVKRLLNLSMAYRLFKDERYAKKVEAELLNVSTFPSWNPNHFLDVAEMTTAVAIGYDWCYDYLKPATRSAVEKAILEKGFAPAWPIYAKTEKTPFNRENNWNMVCNAGLLNGAIAIGDKYPQELEKILDYAVKNTPNLLESFAPEGVFNEGPGYWGYNGMYMSLFFDNLNRNFRNDFGLTQFKGLTNTANFYKAIIGPSNRSFNFGDAAPLENIDYSGTLFYLSKLYKQPEVAAFYRGLISTELQRYKAQGKNHFSRFFFLSIPWFDDTVVPNQTKEEKLTVFNGVTDFLIFNGDNTRNKSRLYLAAKTGKPSWSHNQLDVGSFVVDSEGERWGIDLGPDNYSLPSFWDYKPGGVRWKYFRNSNLSHNTLSIDGKITNSDGQGELVQVNKNSQTPFGVFDMTSSYQDQAASVLRGFKLLSPDAILIKDEINLKDNAQEISWRFLTEAAVSIKDNTATLSQNGKKFYIRCLLPKGYTMQVLTAKTNTPDEKPIKGVSILDIKVNAATKAVSIPVVLGRNIPNIQTAAAANLALKDWQ